MFSIPRMPSDPKSEAEARALLSLDYPDVAPWQIVVILLVALLVLQGIAHLGATRSLIDFAALYALFAGLHTKREVTWWRKRQMAYELMLRHRDDAA